MDTFTATADPNLPQPVGLAKKPSSHFRLIFLILLIAILFSAAATTYILMSKTATPPTTIVETVAPNPFDEPLSENPLQDDTIQTASAEGMFEENASDNFFDQFGDGATASSNVNQNPF